MKIGDRVGVILGSNADGSIDFFGYGVYEGDFVPTEAVGAIAEIAREVGHPNPRMRLDSGSVVWGCESWFGPEGKVKKMLEGRTVHTVSIDEIRAKFTKEG